MSLERKMNQAIDLTEQRGYYRDTDAALAEVFEFYTQYKPQIAQLLEAKRVYDQAIQQHIQHGITPSTPELPEQPGLPEQPEPVRSTQSLKQQVGDTSLSREQRQQALDSMIKRPVLQLAPDEDQVSKPDLTNQTVPDEVKHDQVTKPDLTNQTEQQLMVKAQQVMGDHYQAPAEPEPAHTREPDSQAIEPESQAGVEYEITPERGNTIVGLIKRFIDQHNTKTLKSIYNSRKFKDWIYNFTKAEQYIITLVIDSKYERHKPFPSNINFKGLPRSQWLENKEKWQRNEY
jgi:hypothetical protein